MRHVTHMNGSCHTFAAALAAADLTKIKALVAKYATIPYSVVQLPVCVLQCVAVCCSVLQCVAMSDKDQGVGRQVCNHSLFCCPAPGMRVAVCCSVLQCVAVCCGVLQCVAVCCRVLQCVAVCVWVFIVCVCPTQPATQPGTMQLHTHTPTDTHPQTHTQQHTQTHTQTRAT